MIETVVCNVKCDNCLKTQEHVLDARKSGDTHWMKCETCGTEWNFWFDLELLVHVSKQRIMKNSAAKNTQTMQLCTITDYARTLNS